MPFLGVFWCFLFVYLSEAVTLLLRGEKNFRAPFRTRGLYLRAGGVFLLVYLATAFILTDFFAPLRFTLPSFLVMLGSSFVFSLLLFAVRFHKDEGQTSRRISVAVIAILVLSLFCEVFVFNFRSFESMDYTPTDLTDRITLSNIESEEPDEEGFYHTLHKNKAVYIFFGEFDLPLDNLHLVLEAECDGAPVSTLEITPYLSDEGNEIPYTTAPKTVYTALDETSYIYFNLSGNCRSLRLTVDGTVERLAVREAVFNANVPISFSFYRFALVLFVLLFAYAVRPKSQLYNTMLAPFDRPRFCVTAATVVLMCGVLFAVAMTSDYFLTLMAPWQAQYRQLADAFLNGHLHLFRETPPDFLLSMENPYDTALRASLANEAGESVYWDAAFYNGNY